MDISPETLKVILIIISSISAIAVSVGSYYVINFIKENKRDKIIVARRDALGRHKMTAQFYAISTNRNGFDVDKFKEIYKEKLKELMDEDDIFKD